MLNMFSVRVRSSYLTYTVTFQSNQHVLLCVLEHGAWWGMYIKDNDVKAVSVLPEVDGDEELGEDWDMIE